MTERTFGWIQDPGQLSSLRKVVEVFAYGSETHKELIKKIIPKLISEEDGKSRFLSELKKQPVVLSYRDLIGTSFTPRSSARCNGIIQATIKGQKRPFLADWPADNFVRWAQSLGFIKWIRTSDSFQITKLGLRLSATKKDSNEEYVIYEEAFLSYPPVSRIINLLADSAQNDTPLTKFELGSKLGFIGEKGFTSISQSLFVKELAFSPKKERKEIKSNWEGDSDKYARMICSWLMQLKYPWIKKCTKDISTNFGNKNLNEKLSAYTITRKGFEIRKKINGTSRFKKIPKIVNFEMLSTKGNDREYLRMRRAQILKSIDNKFVTLIEIQEKLKNQGLDETTLTIEDDIKGLENIGISLEFSNGKIRCADKIIGLKIPALSISETQKSDIQQLVEKCRSELTSIPHEYLVLIPLGFDKRQSTLFEIKTVELLTEQCKFNGLHLGSGNRPDGVIFNKDFGVIIDTKAYESGFNIPAPERDKMQRYVNENQARNASHNRTKWWDNFPDNIKDFLFLFVSGKFGGNFKEQLRILSERTNNTLGGVISSYELLNVANKLANSSMSQIDFKEKISCLDEIIS